MFEKPLPLTAIKGVLWSVSASDLGLIGSGTTPEEAMDDLASAIEEAVDSIRDHGASVNDRMRVVISGYVDLDRPCPDPDVELCGDERILCG